MKLVMQDADSAGSVLLPYHKRDIRFTRTLRDHHYVNTGFAQGSENFTAGPGRPNHARSDNRDCSDIPVLDYLPHDALQEKRGECVRRDIKVCFVNDQRDIRF
jgi:hypothetical protein